MTRLSRHLLLVAACYLALSPRTHAQNLFFQPPTYTGTGPSVTADFNKDGKPDLISADGTVQLGKGDGTFTTGTPLGVSGTLIATADFNGDGKPDVLLLPSSGTSFVVLLGNGDGTFQAPITTTPPAILSAVVVADVNGDGKPDVLSLLSTGGVVVFLGKGDGTFTSTDIVYGNSGTFLLVGDFNGDGKADILLGTSSIEVLLGNGDGTFKAAVTSPGPAASIFVAADVNGDGKLDLVASNGASQTVVMLGNGDGTFQAPGSPIPTGGQLGVADFNHDGKPDLVIGSGFTEFYLGNGDGTFTLQDSVFGVAPVSPIPQASIPIADFNGDGKLDVAVGNTVFLGNGDVTFRGNPTLPLNTTFLLGVSYGDFNGDGSVDLAIAESDVSTIDILLNKGDGNFLLAHTYNTGLPLNSIDVADVNHDGKLDLLLVSATNSTFNLNLMLGNGDGTFAAPTLVLQGILSLPVIADVNGDHIPDVVVPTLQGFEIFLGKGDGTFSQPVIHAVSGATGGGLLTADFNGDGKVDIGMANTGGFAVLLGNGDGTFQPPVVSSEINGNAVQIATDVNGDGKADLVAAILTGNATSTTLAVYLSNGDGTFTAVPQVSGFGAHTSFPFAADINGDGKVDLVEDGGLIVLLGNGDGTFGSPITVIPGCHNCFSPQTLAIVDINGDHHPDALLSGNTIPPFQGQSDPGLIGMINAAGSTASGFLISASPFSPNSVEAGATASATVTLTPTNGFGGAVTLSCAALPAGANCSFAPASLASGSGTSTLTITTSASTPAGSYPIGLVGTSSSLTHSALVTLIVATPTGPTTVTLVPKSLTFAQQATGTSSSPQTLQLTNTGSSPLNISGVSINGANAGDFIQTNTCTSPVAAAASCQISVTFKPTGMGTRSASLSVSDNATGSPQMVSLSGSGPDFSFSAGSTSSATVVPGQTATYTLSVAPSAGFNQTVALSCSGAPALANCSISPSSLQLNGTSSSTAMVTITTTAPSMGHSLPFGRNDRFIDPRLQLFLVGLITLMLIGLLFARRRNVQLRWVSSFAFLALLLLAGMLTSCGGSSGSTGTGSPGTAAGAYTITITGSVGTGSSATSHSTTLTLVVQ